VQLAEWLTDAKNPLTARVMANRIWHYHFGKGIVSTPSDFGKQGKAPTHPELLDYLAAKFISGGWSIKALHKTIMLSQVYQLASDGPAENAAADPANDWLSRYNRTRLDAETIRDAMLAVAGNLDETRGGEHPFPPSNKWEYTQHAQFDAVYPTDKRSVYLMQQRIKRHPFLALFDGSDPNVSTAVRSTTTTPIQALFMMNDPFMHDEGLIFAGRILKDEQDDAKRVQKATRLALGREAAQDEIERGLKFITQYKQRLKDALAPAANIDKVAWGAYLRVILSSDDFVFVD
jgi:hypothetical protein